MPDDFTQIGLSSERLTLYEALCRRSERIARMYVGCHVVLKDGINPERVVLAAHAVRELMEKFPEIVAVGTPAQHEKMGAKIGELEQAWSSVVKNSKLKSPKWDGTIDGPTRKFLEKCRLFFDWKNAHMQRRTEETAKTLRALDGPGQILPADLEMLAVLEWQDLQQYFVNIAHHQADPTPEEFDRRITALERILLRKLNPPTFADFDVLDAIIDAGEKSSD